MLSAFQQLINSLDAILLAQCAYGTGHDTLAAAYAASLSQLQAPWALNAGPETTLDRANYAYILLLMACRDAATAKHTLIIITDYAR